MSTPDTYLVEYGDHVEPALYDVGYVVESDADCGMTWIYRKVGER